MHAPSRQPHPLHAQPLTDGRILIVGLGATGLSCARFLAGQGYEIAITDSREAPPGLDELHHSLPEVAVFVGGFDIDAFARASMLVVSPGVSLREPLIIEARARGVEVLGDIELFARFARAPVAAITGSNGKTTVTTLLGEMAREAGVRVAVGGNIGTPALDLLDDAVELYILELSSFQLETTEHLAAAVAVILNISEDHMDRYRGLNEYTRAKTRIYLGSQTLVANRDDARVMASLALVDQGRPVLSFGLDAPEGDNLGVCRQGGENWLCQGEQGLIAEADLRLRGRHNTANALAALALGQTLGLAMPAMLQTLKAFAGLPHRCQWLADIDGVAWYNDSKATNVGAALSALRGIEAKKIILIAGGQGKGQDFLPMREALREHCRAVLLFGEEAPRLAENWADTVPLIQVDSLSQAVARAAELARPGDAVLLSPACASFDMFAGFAQRGEAFIKAVEGLRS